MHGNGVKTDPHGVPARSQMPPIPRLCPTSRHLHSAVWVAGNLFEGEWREGKPIVKDGAKGQVGPLDWLNEAVANVSANIGGGDQRGNYGRVRTYDDDDERR